MTTKYRVWAQAIGRFGYHEECIVEVADGEDPDVVRKDVCDDLIANVVESGWEEVE